MAQRVYATRSDYADLAAEDWPDTDKKLDNWLRRASGDVDAATRLARYAVDAEGYPTDPDVADAFKEAVVAQVEGWGVTDDPTGKEGEVGAIKIGSVSLGTTSSAANGGGAKVRLCEEAWSILSTAGLTSGPVSYC